VPYQLVLGMELCPQVDGAGGRRRRPVQGRAVPTLALDQKPTIRGAQKRGELKPQEWHETPCSPPERPIIRSDVDTYPTSVPADPGRGEARIRLEEKARAAYLQGAEERSRVTLGRPLTQDELERTLAQYGDGSWRPVDRRALPVAVPQPTQRADRAALSERASTAGTALALEDRSRRTTPRPGSAATERPFGSHRRRAARVLRMTFTPHRQMYVERPG
jgi:hypothetical protein